MYTLARFNDGLGSRPRLFLHGQTIVLAPKPQARQVSRDMITASGEVNLDVNSSTGTTRATRGCGTAEPCTQQYALNRYDFNTLGLYTASICVLQEARPLLLGLLGLQAQTETLTSTEHISSSLQLALRSLSTLCAMEDFQLSCAGFPYTKEIPPWKLGSHL